jgi:hypothetical protein
VNGNLNLQMLLTANGSQLASTLNSSSAHVRAFSRNASSATQRMAQGFQRLYHQLNGFSMLSRIAVAAGGYSILSDAMRRNLEFEKALLDMKQTAQMTVKEAAEMRRHAIDSASANMALPSDIAAGMKAFSAAGMKFDRIAPSIDEAARAAVAFRSSVEQIALLDFDLQDKMKLDPKDIKDAHNMLLYHAKSGRYEAAPMATEAPKYLNSVASVGVGGMKGLNFTAAMTQVLMKLAPATQPSEVATFMEHGLGHITTARQVKGLAKFGIDVKKYMPNGKFYGEGGVQGALDLAAEMKRKGLENPFKLDKAGFREMYSKKFWKQLMTYQGDIVRAMKEGDQAALDDMVGRDKAEIMASNYGKVKQWEITKEKGQVSDGATDAVGKVAALEGWAAANPGKAIAGGAAAAIGARLLWKKMTGSKVGGALEQAVGGLGGAGMPVTVTNWPASMGGIKASERLARLPGAASGAAGGAASAAAAGTLATVAAGAAMIAAPAAVAYGFKQWTNSRSGKEADARRWNLDIQQLDRRINSVKSGGDKEALAKLETQRAQQQAQLDQLLAELKAIAARPVEVQIDGHAVATAVNNVNGRDARRQ